jgi:hypothetical protein
MSIENIRRIKQEALIPKPKKTYTIPKKSKKRIEREQREIVNDESLDKWFEVIVKQLTGKCKHCGGKTCVEGEGKKVDSVYAANPNDYLRFSIAHILPKAYFPSVATHPNNWIELCFWNNNCHGNMDNKILDLTEMACWDEIVEKFQRIYPFVAKEERRRIPPVLMNYIEVDL